MVAVTIGTYNQVSPSMGNALYQITYTKAAQNDTINIASYTPIKTILYVLATDDTAGAIDKVTWSGTTITLTDSTTGTGSMIVVGSC